MEFSHTKSGNVIAKSARIHGAQYIINQGLSYIGKATEVHGERNNGKPVISWGKHVILDDGSEVSPSQRDGTYYPLIIGHDVYFGRNSKISAASVGSFVIVGENASVGEFAVLRDGAVVAANEAVPPYTVVGPLARLSGGTFDELPESVPETVSRFCKLRLAGVRAEVPFQ